MCIGYVYNIGPNIVKGFLYKIVTFKFLNGKKTPTVQMIMNKQTDRLPAYLLAMLKTQFWRNCSFTATLHRITVGWSFVSSRENSRRLVSYSYNTNLLQAIHIWGPLECWLLLIDDPQLYWRDPWKQLSWCHSYSYIYHITVEDTVLPFKSIQTWCHHLSWGINHMISSQPVRSQLTLTCVWVTTVIRSHFLLCMRINTVFTQRKKELHEDHLLN